MGRTFVGEALPLSDRGLANVCEQLGTKLPEVWSVLHVETSGCGFLVDRRPKILFERHIFSRESHQTFDTQHPDLSNPKAGGYGTGGAHQHERLAAAIELDEQAALRSASWGIGQIMGFNAGAAGFADVNTMVEAMLESEDNQLIAMANFLKRRHLDSSLRSHDWERFAFGYNGENFAKNNYHKKLEAAFAQYSTLLPDLNVRTAQILLTYLGIDPGAIDGVMGRATRSALEQFQEEQRGLAVTGHADGATLERLRTLLASSHHTKR